MGSVAILFLLYRIASPFFQSAERGSATRCSMASQSKLGTILKRIELCFSKPNFQSWRGRGKSLRNEYFSEVRKPRGWPRFCGSQTRAPASVENTP
jgi:hypothetical protein